MISDIDKIKYFKKRNIFIAFRAKKRADILSYLAAKLHAFLSYRKTLRKHVQKYPFLNKQTKHFVKHANKSYLIHYAARS